MGVSVCVCQYEVGSVCQYVGARQCMWICQVRSGCVGVCG